MTSKSLPSSVTIEEAVARMVNMDYIPTGFSLLDMTSAFLEEAEVNCENGPLDHAQDAELASMRARLEACQARHTLAQLLLADLEREVMNSKSGILVQTETTMKVRLTLESVSDWAAERYGIVIPEWSQGSEVSGTSEVTVPWEEATIKLYADYRIGCFYGSGERKQSHFRDVGLMGKRKNTPNKQGFILTGLSEGKRFPFGIRAENKDAAAISHLRDALNKLTGISSDPFYTFNEGDGWKPRFKLVDDRRNADDRAKERAIHVPFDETRDFDPDEGDEASRWLQGNK